MLHCKFPGDYNSESIFKIGQYLTELCVEHLGFTFFGPPCIANQGSTMTATNHDDQLGEIYPTMLNELTYLALIFSRFHCCDRRG